MFILAIETSGTRGGVALADDEDLIEEVAFEEGMVHGRALVPSMDGMLRRAGIAPREIGLVAVDVGPGSYTGIRVGVAAARMIAFAVGCPVAPVLSTDVLAENADEIDDFLCPIIDARWNQVYAAIYRRDWIWLRTEGPAAYRPEDLAARLEPGTTVFGSGVARYPELFTGWQHGREVLEVPRAAEVASLGLQIWQAGAAVHCNALRPLYLRPTEAEVKFGVAETPSPPGG